MNLVTIPVPLLHHRIAFIYATIQKVTDQHLMLHLKCSQKGFLASSEELKQL